MDIRTFVKITIVFCSLVSLFSFNSYADNRDIEKRSEFPKKKHTKVTEHTNKTHIIVKFKETTQMRHRGGQFVALNDTDLAPLQAVLKRIQGVKIARVFARPEDELTRDRDAAQTKLGKEVADPNLFFTLILPTTISDGDVVSFVDALNALDIVEVAYLQPVPVLPSTNIAPPTPNYEMKQGYLGNSPNGINWTSVYAQQASYPGVTGTNVTIADVEYNWNTTHEDLKDPIFIDGTPGGVNSITHGTAVIGVLIAQKNGYGVTGIVPDAPYGLVSIDGGRNLSQTIDAARARLNAGDVMLLELSQFDARGYMVPVEYDSASFTAIQLATAAGIIVVEPSGNGYGNGGEGANLDDPYYQGIFNRAVRDSGAIMVGAAEMGVLKHRYATIFSNYGSRIDSYGWGNAVATTGGNNELFSADANQTYTSSFNGTSSASPIVAGGAAAIQSYYKQLSGRVFTPWEMRSLLTTTGTAASKLDHYIGTMPNLLNALNLVKTNAARIVDTDHDGMFDDDELTLGINPNIMDTDGDGQADGDEVRFYLSDPNNANTYFTAPRNNGYNTLTSGQFQWVNVPSVDYYQIYLYDPVSNTALINAVVAQSTACVAGVCSFTSTVPLVDGHAYQSWIYTFPKGSIVGGWSSQTNFTSWTTAPQTPSLIAPANTATTSWKPTYSWSAQPGAIGYQIFVGDGAYNRTDSSTFITPGEAGCGNGQTTCSFTWPAYDNSATTGLNAGAATWWVTARNPVNVASSAFSNSMTVSLRIPSSVNPTSPINNAIVSSLPLLKWQSTPYATYYWIEVFDGAGVDYGFLLAGADLATCANGETTCTWQPTGFGSADVPLPAGGTSTWCVWAANAAGYSNYSCANFVVK